MLKNLKHAFEFAFVIIMMVSVNLLPRGAAVRFGRFAGRVGYGLWGFRRRVAAANLYYCFPGKDDEWVKNTARRSFEAFGQAIVENMRFAGYNKTNLGEWARIENESCLGDAAAAGRGALLLTAHYGSYELGGAAVGLAGYPVTFMAQAQSNRLVDALMNRVRRRAGFDVIITGTTAPDTGFAGLRRVVRELRANRVVAMVADQDAGAEGVVVEFFGRPASAARGPAVFALRTGAAFCCGRDVPGPGGRHTVYLEDVVFPKPLGGTPEEDVKYWTQVYISFLEEWCRERPGLYLWMHRRFKSTAPEIYEKLQG